MLLFHNQAVAWINYKGGRINGEFQREYINISPGEKAASVI